MLKFRNAMELALQPTKKLKWHHSEKVGPGLSDGPWVPRLEAKRWDLLLPTIKTDLPTCPPTCPSILRTTTNPYLLP